MLDCRQHQGTEIYVKTSGVLLILTYGPGWTWIDKHETADSYVAQISQP